MALSRPSPFLFLPHTFHNALPTIYPTVNVGQGYTVMDGNKTKMDGNKTNLTAKLLIIGENLDEIRLDWM